MDALSPSGNFFTHSTYLSPLKKGLSLILIFQDECENLSCILDTSILCGKLWWGCYLLLMLCAHLFKFKILIVYYVVQKFKILIVYPTLLLLLYGFNLHSNLELIGIYLLCVIPLDIWQEVLNFAIIHMEWTW